MVLLYIILQIKKRGSYIKQDHGPLLFPTSQLQTNLSLSLWKVDGSSWLEQLDTIWGMIRKLET
jgi:hypothetical protein